jgi:hypothetical protein
MIEYPSIISASKAPRAPCVAFDKLDGSNIRAKWTQKRGFELFGSRHTLIEETHPHLGDAVSIFKSTHAKPLDDFFRKDKEFRNEREIVVFSEFFGAKSFAGWHEPEDPKKLVVFDILVGHKNKWFVKPFDFHNTFNKIVPTPAVIYVGNMNDQLIEDVRAGKYNVNEGVICKGTLTRGDCVGKIWMCKIKTHDYFERLRSRFKEKWEQYAE